MLCSCSMHIGINKLLRTQCLLACLIYILKVETTVLI